MHAFSRSMVDLYSLAEQASYQEFPAEALRLLQRWVGFDGAVLGLGEAGRDPRTGLLITQAHVHQRENHILQAYGAVSGRDPVTGAFLRGLHRPLAVDCRAQYRRRGQELAEMDAFSRSYDLRHLLLFGDSPAAGTPGRWLVLYRAEDAGFKTEDAEVLHAAWLHLSRAIGLHRATLLDRQDGARAQRASALVNGLGGVESADGLFVERLRQQWPAFCGRQLPAELLAALGRGQTWRGRLIEVAARREQHLLVCTARPVDAVTLLTPGETAVARRFAAGLSHKAIARELGVAPNTVRTQITRLYAKLQVHDKAALAQRLMAADRSALDS
nr:LuxR C-terminal-related transcriptional regulator [uncultured Roseateles sp.]